MRISDWSSDVCSSDLTPPLPTPLHKRSITRSGWSPMEDLINEFIAETREMLEALGGEIVAWEAEPDDRGRLDEIFRFVHTVKGNCGFFRSEEHTSEPSH